MKKKLILILRFIKNLSSAPLLPLKTSINKNWNFAWAYPSYSGWKMRIDGVTIPITTTNISCIEYYRYFRPQIGETVYDIGGELGLEMLQFSEMVGNKGKVFTFECLPDHVQNLEILSNKKKNIKIINVACWNEPTELEFYIGNTPGSSTAISDASGQYNQKLANDALIPIKVLADTLDNLYLSLTPDEIIDYLKMDIEGAEIEALEGAKKLLENVHKVVIASYHIRSGKPTAGIVKNILNEVGFHCFIDDNLHVYGINKKYMYKKDNQKFISTIRQNS